MKEHIVSGHVFPDFEPVAEAFEANFREDKELGAGFAVYINGKCVVDLHGGWSDRKKTRPWGPQTLVPVFSTTKAIAALVIAMLLSRDGAPAAGFETPVAQVWPEFAANGKESVTIAQLMSHQAGLPGFREPIDPALWLDPPALAAEIARQPPMWPPGEGSGYHPLTWGYLVGELAWRLSGGASLGSVLREEVTHRDQTDPIDFWLGLPASEHDRVAEMMRPRALPDLGELNEFKRTAFLTKWAAPDRGGALWKEIEIPSANGHGTAAATARLYGFYAGTLDVGIDEAMRAQFLKSRSDGPDRVLPFTIDFACGVMRNSHGIYGPSRSAFGHSGWGGSMALGDPERGLSLAYVMNRQSNHLQGDPRARRLVEAVYGCL